MIEWIDNLDWIYIFMPMIVISIISGFIGWVLCKASKEPDEHEDLYDKDSVNWKEYE